MKQGYCHIAFLLDRTGSMETVKTETIAGFNQFLKEQKALPNECTMTFVQFDSINPYEIIHDFIDLKNVKKLTDETYAPRGYTPLLDAMGNLIDKTGEHLSNMKEEDRPDRVLLVILTDGQENASSRYNWDEIAKKIKHQEEVYNWKVVYLGANQDAIAVAGSMNITKSSTLDFASTPTGIKCAFASASSGALNYRSCDRNALKSMNYFSDKDRDQQTAAGVKNVSKT